MTRYRRFRGAIVEELPDGNAADPILMALIRHHGETEAGIAEILAFCRVPGFRIQHLDALVRHVGRCAPLMATRLDTSCWQAPRMLRCTDLATGTGMRWFDGTLRCDHRPVPDAVAAAMPGRPIGDVLEHPYVPGDLVVDTFEQAGARWTATFRADPKRRRGRNPAAEGEET